MKIVNIFIASINSIHFFSSLKCLGNEQSSSFDSNKFKCISCTSENIDRENCVFNPSDMKKCNNSVEQCYTFLSSDFLYRGCVGDDLIGDKSICDDKSDDCVICSKNVCNNQPLFAEECISHSYSQEIEDHNINSSKRCPSSITPMGCYHQEDSVHGIIRKGCVNELSKATRTDCRNNGPDCKICYGRKCNYRHAFQNCVSCDSRNHTKCITIRDDRLLTEQCEHYHDKCYTFTENNTVRRGCVGSERNEFNEMCRSHPIKCNLCQNNNGLCNNYQIDDMCIKCDSDIDPSCYDNPDTSDAFICSANKKTTISGGCYLQITDDSRIVRGCVDELSSEVEKDECRRQSPECQMCLHQNCNIKKNFKQICHFCNGISDEQCAQGISNKIIECPDYSSSCLVGIDWNGFTHRSCSSIKLYDERTYANGYETCFGDYCNDKIFPKNRLLCYQKNASDAKPTPCKIYSKNEECVVYVGEGNILLFIVFMFVY